MAVSSFTTPRECPGCGRIMSAREAAEQGACNDCNGGAADLGYDTGEPVDGAVSVRSAFAFGDWPPASARP